MSMSLVKERKKFEGISKRSMLNQNQLNINNPILSWNFFFFSEVHMEVLIQWKRRNIISKQKLNIFLPALLSFFGSTFSGWIVCCLLLFLRNPVGKGILCLQGKQQNGRYSCVSLRLVMEHCIILGSPTVGLGSHQSASFCLLQLARPLSMKTILIYNQQLNSHHLSYDYIEEENMKLHCGIARLHCVKLRRVIQFVFDREN